MTVIPFKLNPLNKISNAETEIFRKASKSNLLNDQNIYFFHSLRLSEAGNKLVGEVDFVYLDDLFILFLEVKGGTVYYNASLDKWSTQGGKSEKDPFYQVCSALFDVRDKKIPNTFINKGFEKKLIFGYGVLFPDCYFPSDFNNNHIKPHSYFKADNIEYNMDLVYTFENHKNPNGLDLYLNQLKDYWQNYPKYINHKTRLSKDDVTEIKNYFRKDLVFETPILDLLKNDENETDYYTQQQSEMLEIVRMNSEHGFLISGGPGTGKTLLAIEKAKQLIEEGKKVLIVCYNKPLSLFITDKISKLQMITSDNITLGSADVFNFHSLLLNTLKSYHGEINIIEKDDFWKNTLPKLFIETFKSIVVKKIYDYIIVDEGQDLFTEINIDCLKLFLKDGLESGNYLIFLDRYYQQVYNSFSNDYFLLFKQIYNSFEFTLTMNCRNTPNIIDKAYYDTGMPITKCLKKELFNPEMIFYNSETDLINIINSKVKYYLSKGVSQHKITILTRKELIEKIIQSNINMYTKIKYDNINLNLNQIVVSTPHSFKGLENQIIIFAGYDRYDAKDSMLMSQYYVGYTRATSILIVVLNRCVEKIITSNIEKHISEIINKSK